MEEGEPSRPRRWPAAAAIVTAYFVPQRAALRTRHVSLVGAWLVHVLSAVLLAVVILYLIAWRVHGGSQFLALTGYVIDFLLRELVGAFTQSPVLFVLAALGVILGVELGMFKMALLVMPWGARNERLGASYWHALRLTWLFSAGLLPVIGLIVACGLWLDRKNQDWLTANPRPPYPMHPSPPTGSPLDPTYAEKTAEYEAALEDYRKELAEVQPLWDAWRRAQPWYIREPELVIVALSVSSGLWVLCAFLRGVGAPRSGEQVERAPTCDFCGYNLSTLPMDGRCPECGAAVLASLGPDVRKGSAWEHRYAEGALRAWRKCALDAAFATQAFARRLALIEPGTAHRGFLALHLPVVFLVGAVGLVILVSAAGDLPRTGDEMRMALIVCGAFGACCMAGTVGVTLFAASLVGVVQSLRNRRNLLTGSVQVACYLSPYLVAWSVFGAASAIAVVGLDGHDWFDAGQALTGMDDELLMFLFWFLPNTAWGLWYIVLVVRGTVAMRYANR